MSNATLALIVVALGSVGLWGFILSTAAVVLSQVHE